MLYLSIGAFLLGALTGYFMTGYVRSRYIKSLVERGVPVHLRQNEEPEVVLARVLSVQKEQEFLKDHLFDVLDAFHKSVIFETIRHVPVSK